MQWTYIFIEDLSQYVWDTRIQFVFPAAAGCLTLQILLGGFTMNKIKPLFATPTTGGRNGAGLNALRDSSVKILDADQQLLFDELNHRLKNNLQMVLGLLQSACRNT